jgi:hypothetical protein
MRLQVPQRRKRVVLLAQSNLIDWIAPHQTLPEEDSRGQQVEVVCRWLAVGVIDSSMVSVLGHSE